MTALRSGQATVVSFEGGLGGIRWPPSHTSGCRLCGLVPARSRRSFADVAGLLDLSPNPDFVVDARRD
jgi:hypothetical protein